MATNLQQITLLCLLFWQVIFVTWQPLTTALSVNVKRTTARYNGHPMPDTLHVTLAGESGTPIDLNLQRVEYAEPNVPVYTLQVDEKGRRYANNEELENNQNIAYYHDLESQAAMQVTRVGNKGDNSDQYELKGSVTVEGKLFSLEQEKASTRKSHLSSENEVTYSLIEYEPIEGVFDYVKEAPALIDNKFSHKRSTFPQQSHYSSAENFDSRQSGTDIFLDIVAMADYRTYKAFLSTNGNRQSAMQAMQKYYTQIMNSVDWIYRQIQGIRYTFSVRLTRLIVCETADFCSFVERFNKKNTLDADSAIRSLATFIVYDELNIVNPYDHVMVFTKLDLYQKDLPVPTAVIGYATIQAICSKHGYSSSLIEDQHLNSSTALLVAAHELGHGIGANHDGVNGNCPSLNFLMAPTLNWATKFSSCSIRYFTNSLNQLLALQDRRQCLTGKLPISDTPVKRHRSRNLVPTTADQCQMIYGKNSKICKMM